jgi:hypothetical protein
MFQFDFTFQSMSELRVFTKPVTVPIPIPIKLLPDFISKIIFNNIPKINRFPTCPLCLCNYKLLYARYNSPSSISSPKQHWLKVQIMMFAHLPYSQSPITLYFFSPSVLLSTLYSLLSTLLSHKGPRRVLFC